MEKPIFLLLNGKNPLEATGGYQTYTRILAKKIKELGYEVEIYCFGRNNQIVETKIGTLYEFKTRFSIPLFAFPALALILALKINIKSRKNYVLWGIGPWSLSAAIYKFFHPTKNAVFISYYPTTISHEVNGANQGVTIKDHGLMIKTQIFLASLFLSKLYSLFERFTLSRCALIINHYYSIQKILRDEFKISQKKQILTPELLDTITKPSLGKTKKQLNHPSVVFIGRHDPRKGINYLLWAFSILNKRNIKFNGYIIGDGMLYDAHKKLADKLKLKNVHILGMVKNKESYLKIADIFILPSLEEGSSSISINEAMSWGLPIISTNVDGIPEDIKNGISGILVSPKDPISLANALEKLLLDNGLSRKLGNNARKEYMKMYDKQKSNKELKRLISKCESLFQDPNKIRSQWLK